MSDLPPEVVTAAATLRTAAEWFSGDDRDTMREVADQAERDRDGICCPVCEEVDCDEGCPLEHVRAALQEKGRREADERRLEG
ncbi:hypothetical protein [Streptomyces sp. NRRL F-5135]|uniref:hypothetical protein n=1 Tax=Streptomyces sp. NRRL F-5135 TaxID=1463858 RepID=UPI0004C7F9C8|nr:hypothetical protein [Streptomyces sp. NRRL F-5135]